MCTSGWSFHTSMEPEHGTPWSQKKNSGFPIVFIPPKQILRQTVLCGYHVSTKPFMKLINFLLFHGGCSQTEFPPGCIQVHVCSRWQYQLYCALFVALRRSRCSQQSAVSDIPCCEALSHPGPWPFQNTRGGQWVNMALGVLFPFVVSGCAKMLNYAKLKFQIRGPLEFSCSVLGATWVSMLKSSTVVGTLNFLLSNYTFGFGCKTIQLDLFGT